MNNGKDFEKLIKDSCKVQSIDWTRLKDAGWQGVKTKDKRFTINNICDFILFDSKTLLYLEAKTKQESFSGKNDLKQLERLIKKKNQTNINNVKCGFLLNFSKQKETFYISAKELKTFLKEINKKSFTYLDVIKSNKFQKVYGIKYKIKTYLNIIKLMGDI